MRLKIVCATLLFVSMFVFTNNHLNNQPKVSTYSIFEKPSFFRKTMDNINGVKKDDRHHAIINIVDDIGMSCTAFVVTDKFAVTAGHCLEITSQRLDEITNVDIPESEELERKYLQKIANLEINCRITNRRCMREIEYVKVILEKELIARAQVLSEKADTFKVINVHGEDTNIEATADFKHKSRDYGIIRGDFKKFKKMHSRIGWHVKPGDTLKSCGFFGGKLPPTCVDFLAEGNYGFSYRGQGVLVPGISGGPVVDNLGYVVGIASSAHPEFIVMVPFIGIMDLLTDKQLKKRKEKEDE